MFKKFTALCIAVIFAVMQAPFACAQTEKKAEVTDFCLYDLQNNPIMGKIEKNTEFYFTANVKNTSGENLTAKAYLAVFEKGTNALADVFESEDLFLKNGENSPIRTDGKIPNDIADEYFIKIFVFEKTTLVPLCNAVSFDASSAYETEKYNGGYLSRDIIIDPSFEDDSRSVMGWNPRSASEIQRTADYAFDKNYSCKVSNRVWDSDAIRQDITENLKKSGSGEYRVRYSVLTDAVDVNFQIIIALYDKNGVRASAKPVPWNALYIKTDAEHKNQWMSAEKSVNITVPENFYSAEVYVEMLKNISDFYIDFCSIRKVITYEDYLAENAYFCEIDTARELENLIGKKSDYASIHPMDTNEVLKNPYKGLNYYTTKLDFSKLNLSGDGAKISNVVYARYGWAALEPEDGVYNFDQIEENINYCAENGMMLGIGIGSTVCYNSASDYRQDTPGWLFTKYGAKSYDLKIGNNNLKIPYYNDAVFLDKMQRFLDKFAERFNGNKNIAYVDMRVYGNWGEWHFYSSVFDGYRNSVTYTDEDFKKLVDLFKNFRLPLAMFSSNTMALNYASDTLNAGIRVDGTMNPGERDEHLKLKRFDGKNFAVAEWFAQPETFYPAGTYNGKTYSNGKYSKYFGYLPTFIEKTIREGAVSYISLGYWNPEDFYKMFHDLSKRMANETGYWFKPISFKYPKNFADGYFMMAVKNDGSAPLYAGYKQNSGVKLALADADGNILEKITLDANPKNWKAGEISYITQKISFKNKQNASHIYLGVFSDVDAENPDIKLGITAECKNGWYDICHTENAENTSDNRLYYSSLAFAEDGYGYRDLRYAFDGSADTYFASEVREGEYFEVDFGEYENISSIVINAKEKTNAKIFVYAKSDGALRKITEINGLNAGENTLPLSCETSKIRFTFGETRLGESIKISSIKMN